MAVTAEYPYVFPPLWFFLKALHADVFFLADGFKIPKRPRINRYRVAGGSGEQELTVPVHRPHGWASAIAEVRLVGDEHWKQTHLRTLQNDCAAAPYLEYYLDELRQLLGGAGTSFFEFARSTILWLAEHLGLQRLGWLPLSEACAERKGDDCLLEACLARGARVYVQLEGAADVRDEARFRRAGVEIGKLTLPPFRYRNLAGEGHWNLSALDFLLNYGPEAALKLRQVAGGAAQQD